MVGTIYKITSPNGKVYIGQSWNYRFRKYLYKSKKAKGQPKLHNSFLKYGYDAHEFKILYQNQCTQIEIDNLEIEYINKYKSIGEVLNIRLGGSRGKHSEETKIKLKMICANRTSEQRKNKSLMLSAIHSGKVISDEHKELCRIKFAGTNNPSAKPIKQYLKNGEFLKDWDYMTLAAKYYSIDVSCIAKCCKGTIKTSGGFVWKYAGWQKISSIAD